MEPNVLSRRIEQLAALAGDEPDATGSGTAVASLRGELAGLRADLAALRGEVGSVRTDIDGLAGRITGSVAANRTETGTLARRVADLVNRIDVVGVRVDEVKTDLPILVRELRDGLELVPGRTGAKFDELTGKLGESVGTRVDAVAGEVRRTVVAALERTADNAAATQGLMAEARSALESRMAVVEDALDALSERLEALLRDGAHTTRDQLRELAVSLVGLEQRVDAASGEQVERIVARLQGVIEHRLDNFSAVLADATRTRNEQLRRELLDMLTRASSEQESTRNRVAVLVDAVQLAAAEQVVATTALIGGTAASLAEVREDIQTELDDVAERLLVTVADLRAQQDARAASREARADALQASLEGSLDAVRAQVATAMEAARADVAADVAALRPPLEELVAGTAALAHAGAAHRAELQHALETVGERVAFSVSASTESVQTALDDLNNRFGDATRSTHEALLDRLGEHHSTVTGRLADVAAATAGGTSASRDAGERLAALATSQEETRRSVEALQGDWPTRVDQAAMAARVTAEAAVTELRAEVRVQLDAVIAEVARAVAGVEQATAKLDAGTVTLSSQADALAGAVAPAVEASVARTVGPTVTAALALVQKAAGPAPGGASGGASGSASGSASGGASAATTSPAVDQPRAAAEVEAAVPPARKARRTQAQAGASTSDKQAAGSAVAAAPTGEVRSGPKARAAQKAAPRQPTKATSVPVKPMKPVAETRAHALASPEPEPPVPPTAEATARDGERASGKRAVLEAMPEVPSPATALEAASAPARPAPPAQPTAPAPAARRGPVPSASSGRPGAEELRRIFRRRKP